MWRVCNKFCYLPCSNALNVLYIFQAWWSQCGLVWLADWFGTNAAHQEALRKEIERLRQVYQQQNLKMDKTNSCINPNKWLHNSSPVIIVSRMLIVKSKISFSWDNRKWHKVAWFHYLTSPYKTMKKILEHLKHPKYFLGCLIKWDRNILAFERKRQVEFITHLTMLEKFTGKR